MKFNSLVVSTGLALFAMFFGSGNLVFPLLAGTQSEGHYIFSSLGIVLTGVLVPFMGVLAMLLYQGDTGAFLGTMGKHAKFWFSLIALSLMGPFGVLARCITVAHGSFELLFPKVPLVEFSLIFCSIIFLLTVNRSKIVSLLGTFITPFLLISLFVIISAGFVFGETPETVNANGLSAFGDGALKGYQLMDLLAGFFFSTFIIQHLSTTICFETNKKELVSTFLKSAFLGGALLSIVYCGLVYLGSAFSTELTNVPPQAMLGVIAQKTVGPYSAPLVCLAVVLACFTTAVVLTTLFADFFRDEVCNHKVKPAISILVTLSIAFWISTFEFSGIAAFLAPILETLYPALIVLTLVNIANKIWGVKQQKWPVMMTFAAKLINII
jgi:LIVCS family branched-chain amino acid:cation transporter